MPKENRKRGRRDERKKRKLENADEDHQSKRYKAEEQPDFMPLPEENGACDTETTRAMVAQPAPADLPFYGMLDEEEQEYFKRADEMLELNQFEDAEARDLFLANVYREADGKELKIANSQSCSRLMERLIQLSNASQLKALFQKFSGHFLNLVQHRFASHCCEALFIRSAPVVTQEVISPPQDQYIDPQDVQVSMENLFLYAINELEGNLGYLMTDRFASHTIRVLLIVLAGQPLARSSHRSLLQSKRKEKISAPGAEQANEMLLDQRAVPESFLEAMQKMIDGSIAGLDTTYLRALASHPTGNPVLQLLVQLELTRFGKQRAKDENSIIRRLLPDDPITEGTESASFINGLTYDPVGSRLLEAIIEHAPGKMFKALFKEFFRERVGSLARNEVAGYVAAKVLERLSKEDLQEAMNQLLPQIPALVERNRTAIIRTLIERCAARSVDTGPLAKQLQTAYGGPNGFDIARLLKLGETTPDEKVKPDGQSKTGQSNPDKLHGSLLAQTMLNVPGALSGLIFESLARVGTPLALNMARSSTASRTLQGALTSPSATIIFRRKVIQQLYGHVGELALDPSASHVIDAVWEGTAGLAFIRERIAEELAENEAALRESHVGRKVWRNWKMDLYKRRRADWVAQSRASAGTDAFVPFPDGAASGQKKKSGIELARQRHAAARKMKDRAAAAAGKAAYLQQLIIPFIRQADADASQKGSGRGLAIDGGGPRTALVEHHPPQKLEPLLDLKLPAIGLGKDGLLHLVQRVLQYSVNTWDQGFLDKLYSSTNAVGLVSELILATLNTNVHVYQVSPALTLIEKHTSKQLAALFGYTGAHAGGISQPGGSASNSSSLVIARNTLFPETKDGGIGGRRFVLFTSAHGHYSLEKAAQMFGFGSKAVRGVPVDDAGRLRAEELDRLVKESKDAGETPFYVNATAGTTVMGSFDPIDEMADVCERHGLWLHVDGSWGGPVAFNERLRKERLRGVHRADSIAVTPHKMLGVPVTCSFLLGKDMRQFWKAMTLPAGYLFHNTDANAEIYDLADLTPQCGRKGDALKLFLSWNYYGTAGFSEMLDRAFSTADYLLDLLSASSNIVLVSKKPLPCLQVCFYWAKNGKLDADADTNGARTAEMARRLVPRGWMVDYAPGEQGKFFRVVVNAGTMRSTVEGLLKAIEEVGHEVLAGQA
ncbi:PLP-dependent transferase [Saccharata proteae CBS 121410]|uniref:PLP-dependent transferase n=1 Tax=Saccharata proteae CBS 121410 TaxID=1314787 RepID=A0A9P4HX76_9PEZI|nr:PLP-dependent transferase [Saccharata proteae CBS 121410]